MLHRATTVLMLAIGLASTPACSGPAQRTADAPETDAAGGQDDANAGTPDAQDEPAPYPALAPTAVQERSSGGPVLTSPRAVPVFFPGQENAGALADFMSRYLGSELWHQATAQYGVGPGVAATAVQPLDPLPSTTMTTDDLAAWLASELDGTHAAWGPTDAATLASSIYVVFPPVGTALVAPGDDADDPYAPTLCGGRPWDPTGWHWQTGVIGAANVPASFVVVGSCPPPGVAPLDGLTGTLSHELAEAATDPLFATSPAYWTVDQAHAFWLELTSGGEIGDLCLQEQTPFLRSPEIGYVVQRTWSNVAASAGHAPCVPDVAPAYFDVEADAPDWLLDPYVDRMVEGVAIPAGGSRTIDVRLFSDAPTAAWQVHAVDPSAAQGGPPLLDLSLDHGSGSNGDVLHLTIRPLFEGSGTTALYELDSTLDGATQTWLGEIVVK